MKEMNLVILLRLIAYVYSGAFYQLLPSYSFNFKNPKTQSVISSFILKGDATKGKESFKLTNNKAESYGLLQTHKALNVSQFEYQVTFKISAKYTRGSVLGIWFYSEKSEAPQVKTFFGFTNQFKGFGILVYTMPEIREDLTTLFFRLILNENGTLLAPIDLNQLDKESTCTEHLSKRDIKITIKTKENIVQVMFDNINSLINHCCHAFANLVYKKEYNIALTSFNGEYNNTLFQDEIEIPKVAMFNTYYKDSRPILGLPELPAKEYDYQLNEPLRKYEDSKANKSLTLDDLSKMINKCSVDSLKLKEQMKKEEMNMTFLYQAIPFLADNTNYLIELFNKTLFLILENEEHDLFSFKVKIIATEYTGIVLRWLAIRSNATSDNEKYNRIQQSLLQMHNDITVLQNMEFYEGDKIDVDISPLNMMLSNKGSSSSNNNNLMYAIIGLLVLIIAFLIFQILRKTTKEKTT